MIEFKAECGHTIRAKDEDVGKVVRCAYCGREAQVPEDEPEDDLDFLFGDLGKEGAAAGKAPRAQTKKQTGGRSVARTRRGVDPFSVVTKMAYVAVILIAVIFIGKKYAWPLMNDRFFSGAETSTGAGSAVDARKGPATRPAQVRKNKPRKKYGLVDPRLEALGDQGIYVNAVPRDVQVFYRETLQESKKTVADSGGHQRWFQDPAANRIGGSGYTKTLKAGTYDVVAMLPVNDPQLKQTCRGFGYDRFRDAVEPYAGRSRADQAADEYFLPDGGSTKVVHMGEPIYVVRQYEVTVRTGRWQVLTPLFIPFACDMGDVANRILPRSGIPDNSFGFDSNDIKDELTHYKVPDNDQKYIVDILRRIGSISYHDVPREIVGTPREYPFRMFKISPADGIFTARHVEGVKRRPAQEP